MNSPKQTFRSASIIVNSLAGGGAEKVALALAGHLSREGRTMSMLLLDHAGDLLNKVPSGVQLSVIPETAKRFGGLGRIAGLAWALRRQKPELVLSMGEWPNVLAPPACKLALPRVGLVLSERNSVNPVACFNSGAPRRLASYSYGISNGIISVSHTAEQLALRIAGKNWRGQHLVGGNPVACDKVETAAREPLPNAAGEWPRPFVLAIGRLEPQKNFRMLISAFANALGSEDVDLIILGQGAEKKGLERTAEECGIASRLHLPGFQANPWAWIARCRLFAMSSDYEGLSNSLIEAMVLGANVVATTADNGALESGRWGRVVAVGDRDAFANALGEAFRSAAPQELIFHARATYSFESVMKRYESFLNQVYWRQHV
jgi:glycosyltransferase involved in cell wall biosynthesis